MALTRQEADAVLGLDQPLDVADVAFVAALRASRRDAFERLVAEYQTQLYSVALRIVQDREDARDVVQEVFIKAFRALPETRGHLHLRAWLYRVTINASYDHLRACKRRPLPVEDELLERPTTIDESEQADLVRMFAQTLRTLPRRQQVALLLKDVHGLPHSEIAEALGISRGSAEVLLFRARSGFRRTFTTLSDLTVSPAHCGFAEHQSARAVGGGLPPSRRRQLLEHARTCPDCRRTLEGVGGGALGLAVAFPLVAMSGGTAAAAGLMSSIAAGAAAGVAGAASTAATLGAGAAAGTAAAGCATTAGTVMGGTAAGSLAGGGAIAGGIVAKLGALAGMKAAAAVVAGACVVTAGGVAGIEIVNQERNHDAGRAGASVGTPAMVATVAPASEGGAAVRTDRGEGSPTAAALAALSAAALASPSTVASPSSSAIVVAGPGRRPARTMVASAGLRRSPRLGYVAILRRWHAAGLPWSEIEPWSGRSAWVRAIAVLGNGPGGGRGVGNHGAQVVTAGATAQTVQIKKQTIGQAGKITVKATVQASVRKVGSTPQARPTTQARPAPQSRPTPQVRPTPHAPRPRPTPRPEHTWQQAQPTPAPVPSSAPEPLRSEERDEDGVRSGDE